MSLLQIIDKLPSVSATASRDYGRGYAQAIRDVLAIIEVVPAYSQAIREVDRYLEKKREEAAHWGDPATCSTCKKTVPPTGTSFGLCDTCWAEEENI